MKSSGGEQKHDKHLGTLGEGKSSSNFVET